MKTELTPFGKLIRILRIEEEVKTKDMADEIGVSVAYLSAVETGKKKLSDSFIDSVVSFFSAKGIESDKIYNAADKSKQEFTIKVKESPDESRELVAQFARKFQSLTDEDTKQLIDILGKVD